MLNVLMSNRTKNWNFRNWKKAIFTCLLSISVSYFSFAQIGRHEQKGNKRFDYFAYGDAISHYEKAGQLSTQGTRNLIECYLKCSQFEKGGELIFDLIGNGESEPADFYTYSCILNQLGQHQKAHRWFEEYATHFPNSGRVASYQAHIKNWDQISQDQGRFRIRKLEFNSQGQEMGLSYAGSKVVFASNKDKIPPIKRRCSWLGQNSMKLYEAEITKGQITSEQRIDKFLGEQMIEGQVGFNRSLTVMAFAKYVQKKHNTVLQIFFAQKNDDGNWGSETPFELNSADYSVCHPYLLGDGKTMYFSSDMPGGFGGADIYKIEKNKRGNWQEPVNLGPVINTEGNEMFPFFHESEDLLFFASDGHLGLGGLDNYVAPIRNSKILDAINVGVPLNSIADDYSLVLDEQMILGHFSSNRNGYDDVYGYDLLEPFDFESNISGVVKDQYGKFVEGVHMVVFDKKNKPVGRIMTNLGGGFSFNVPLNSDYRLTARKLGYYDYELDFETSDKPGLSTLDVEISKQLEVKLSGQVTDAKSGVKINGATIIIMDYFFETTDKVSTNQLGTFEYQVLDKRPDDKLSYQIAISHPEYRSKTLTYNSLITGSGTYHLNKKLNLSLFKIE